MDILLDDINLSFYFVLIFTAPISVTHKNTVYCHIFQTIEGSDSNHGDMHTLKCYLWMSKTLTDSHCITFHAVINI